VVHQEDFDIIENVLPKDDAVVMSCWQTVKAELTPQADNSAMPKLVDELRDIIGVCVSELAYPKDYARAMEILNQLSA